MNKVYLLLRNNNQTGPHSLEELIQLGLKPLDLIWIEGKSFSWSYPSEISALKPYVAQSNQSVGNESAIKEPTVTLTASSSSVHQAYMPPHKETPAQQPVVPAKKVYVSMPSNKVQQPAPVPSVTSEPQQLTNDDLEKKAEELRKRTQAYVSGNKPVEPVDRPVRADNKPVAPVNKPAATDDGVQVKYARPVGELEDEYSSWIYKQKSKKKKNVAWGGIAAAVAVVLLLGAGFGISRYDSSETVPIAETESVSQELTQQDVPNGESLIPPPSEPEATPPQTVNDEKPSSTVPETVKKDNTSFASNTSSASVPKKETHIQAKTDAVKGTVLPPKPVEKEKEVTVTPVETNKKAVVKAKEETGVTPTETPAKKKTVGSAITGFFNKFKRKIDAVQDEEGTANPEIKTAKPPVEKPQSTTQDPPGTERKATRRGDEPNTAQATAATPATKTNFEDLIDITSNEPAEKWMLGVHGLKLTIHNRSKEALHTAAVEVRYYSEQNELLEKKVVNFANVPPLKSATQPIPDHRLADHTEYRFLSAN